MHCFSQISILPSGMGSTSPTSPGGRSTPARSPIQYRIEERRRTIYVTSDSPPTEEDVDKILEDIPERPMSAPVEGRRHAQVRREIHVVDNTLVHHPRLQIDHIPAVVALESPASAKFVNKATSPNVLVKPRVSRHSPQTPTRPRIYFYHKGDPYYGFTNFSPHPVLYNGKLYPTSEHLFQSFKFQEHRPNLAEHIRTCSQWPSVAFREARRFQPEVRHDWQAVNIEKMEEALFYKFTQHPELRDELLGTGDAELIEDSDKDSFWGVGADRLGRNELGKALERLRTILRGG